MLFVDKIARLNLKIKQLVEFNEIETIIFAQKR